MSKQNYKVPPMVIAVLVLIAVANFAGIHQGLPITAPLLCYGVAFFAGVAIVLVLDGDMANWRDCAAAGSVNSAVFGSALLLLGALANF